MEAIRVGLGERAYTIHIGPGGLVNDALFADHVAGRRVAVITNEVVAPLYLRDVTATLERAGAHPRSHVLPDGEQTKDWSTLERIIDWMLAERFGRDAVAVAMGGGVIGDLVGFAAAIFQRGVPFLQVPTTLLAQVDSSVGGKTGINHSRGKNLVGAFHQPVAVISDVATLNSLPQRELRAGIAEVIKHGFALDAAFIEWLENNVERLLAREPDALTYAVRRSCELKSAIVAADERESGLRAVLNFGHTFGHAIEAAQGYGNWLHGEAVAAGMVHAARLSVRIGLIQPAVVRRLSELLRRAGLPNANPGIAPERMLELMQGDKKVEKGRLRFVVLEAAGAAVLRSDVDDRAVLAALAPGER